MQLRRQLLRSPVRGHLEGRGVRVRVMLARVMPVRGHLERRGVHVHAHGMHTRTYLEGRDVYYTITNTCLII